MYARLVALPVLIVLAAAVVVAGCDSGAEPPAPPPTKADSPPNAGCARPAAGEAAASSELIPGPSNGLSHSTAAAQSLVIEAVILDRGCRPAAGAVVHVWHADAQGLYGPAAERCCYYDGTVPADQNGRFRLRTIRPAQYPVPGAPPAHIHLEISHSAGNLGTEIVFAGSPPTGLVTPTGGELAVALRQDGTGWRGDAVFVLPGLG